MTQPKVDIKDLVPQHLQAGGASSAELKDQVVERLTQRAEDPADERTARMRSRSYTFQFNFVDGTGKAWQGTFTNQVPDIRTRQAIGVLRAELAGGTRFDALDPLTNEICMLVSHLQFTLDEKRPDWAKDFQALDNLNVLRALWAEVAQHEATFLGL